MLHGKGLSSFICIPLNIPQPGQILLTEGTLPYGMEYPNSKLAILTEGQLIAKTAPKRKAAKKTGSTNRQKRQSKRRCGLSGRRRNLPTGTHSRRAHRQPDRR